MVMISSYIHSFLHQILINVSDYDKIIPEQVENSTECSKSVGVLEFARDREMVKVKLLL